MFFLCSFPVITWHLSCNNSYWHVIIIEMFCYSCSLSKTNTVEYYLQIWRQEDLLYYLEICLLCLLQWKHCHWHILSSFVLIHQSPAICHLALMISKKTQWLKECFKTHFFLAVKADHSYAHILLYLPWVISYYWLEVSTVRCVSVTYWVTNVWELSFSSFYHTDFSIVEFTFLTVWCAGRN